MEKTRRDVASMVALNTLAAADELEQRFRELVLTDGPRFVRLAYHLTGGDRELAKDVAQEALVKAYRALPRFRAEAELSTWVTRILIHEAGNTARRQAVRRRALALWPWASATHEQDERSDESGDPARGLERERLRARIAVALVGLSPGQRAVFALVHLEERSVEEAAQVLGKSVGTVKSHLHRALVALRRELGDLRTGGVS